jgi:predicted Rdx family selenoprotein
VERAEYNRFPVSAAETIVSSPPGASRRPAARFLAEPIVHFFVVGALLFVAHRLVVGDPRVIVVTPGVKADVARRFRDSHERPPSAAELDEALGAWKREEALYREALRERLDRNDATIRTVLADRVRARAAVGVPPREPTAAELEQWFATHRSLYEMPRRYDYGTVAFPRTEKSATAARDKYELALKGGADPRTLGRPIVGGNLTVEELRERVGPALAAVIASLPVGQGRRFENEKELLLIWVNAVDGGLPNADQLHKRLVADWFYGEHTRATDQAVQTIVDRYRFEDGP